MANKQRQIEPGAFSIEGAAAYIDGSTEAIYALLREGKITSFLIGAKKTGRRIPKASIDAFMQSEAKPGLEVAPQVSSAKARSGRLARSRE